MPIYDAELRRPDKLEENLLGQPLLPRTSTSVHSKPHLLAQTSSSVHSSPRMGNEISDTDVDFSVVCGFFTPLARTSSSVLLPISGGANAHLRCGIKKT
jgi:hypothetical protein